MALVIIVIIVYAAGILVIILIILPAMPGFYPLTSSLSSSQRLDGGRGAEGPAHAGGAAYGLDLPSFISKFYFKNLKQVHFLEPFLHTCNIMAGDSQRLIRP